MKTWYNPCSADVELHSVSAVRYVPTRGSLVYVAAPSTVCLNAAFIDSQFKSVGTFQLSLIFTKRNEMSSPQGHIHSWVFSSLQQRYYHCAIFRIEGYISLFYLQLNCNEHTGRSSIKMKEQQHLILKLLSHKVRRH